MRGSADLILDEFELAGVKGLAFMFDGLVSNTQVSDFLLRPINRMARRRPTRKAVGVPALTVFVQQRAGHRGNLRGSLYQGDERLCHGDAGWCAPGASLGYQGFETPGRGARHGEEPPRLPGGLYRKQQYRHGAPPAQIPI